ncbi:MAG: GNAT family N-acetyltransferase [Planctomycetota bacterium]
MQQSVPSDDHTPSPVHGLQEAVPRRRDWLAGLEMNAAAIAGYPGASLLQKGRERELWWIPPSPSRPTLVAKVHREKDLSARLRRRLGWGRARLEWHFLKSAEELEVPVPRPVGWFTSPDGDGVFTEYLLDTEPFPQYLQQFEGAERAVVLHKLGELVARLVKAGLEARDLHTGNILARGSDAASTQLWVVDLHDARLRLSLLPAAQERMLIQVAQALGGVRSGSDVEQMLEGWAAAARQWGIDARWGRGPVTSVGGVARQAVCPQKREYIERIVERKELRRRMKRLRRGVSIRRSHSSGNGHTWTRFPHGQRRKFPDRLRWRTQTEKSLTTTSLMRSWHGNLVEQLLLHRAPPALLYRRSRGSLGWRHHLLEPEPEGMSLRKWLMDSDSTGAMESVLREVRHLHRQGIRLGSAVPERWHLQKTQEGWSTRIDPHCLEYQGFVSARERLEDLLAVTSHYGETVSRTDRLRWIIAGIEQESDRRSLRKDWRRGFEGMAKALSDPRSLPWSEKTITAVSARVGQAGESLSVGRIAALHRLNEANAPEVGSLESETFTALLQKAQRIWTIDDPLNCDDDPAGLLVVMMRDADYDSPNFQWFQRGFDRFAYVDRIAIDERSRRQGIGEGLYLTLEAWARHRGLKRIVCEVNLHPRNETSLAFHFGFGFREVGQFIGRGKGVMMLEKLL